MPISFSQIHSNIKVPLYWVEVDPSKAGLPVLKQPSLIVGTMIDAGEATPDVAIAIGSQAQADAAFGIGSEGSRMYRAFFANNFANETWALPLKEPVGAAAATGTITILTPATEAGTIHLYIGGEHVAVNIGTTDTIDQIATAIADMINDDLTLPVTATAAAAVVTLTAVWKGINTNEIRIDVNYYGTIGGERLPNGFTMTLPTNNFLTGGSGTPDMSNAIANLGEKEFEYVAMPYTDSNSLFDWNDEFGFSDHGRWGWQRQLFGHIFSAKRGAYSDLVLFGNTQNSGTTSILAFEVQSPSPSYE